MQEDTIWSNIFKKEQKKETNIFMVLHKIPIFQDLTKRELKAIDRILHRRTYKKDEVVFNEDEPGMGRWPSLFLREVEKSEAERVRDPSRFSAGR